MNATPSNSSGRVLLAAAVLLAVAGAALVASGLNQDAGPPAHASSPPPSAAGLVTPAVPNHVSSPVPAPPPTARPSLSAPEHRSPSPAAGGDAGLAPPESGPAADPVVQRALDQAVPADLPPATARRLTTLGRAVWMADVTGSGRARWPGYFPRTEAAAPYTRVRIQAAIARRDGADNRAVVRLVWAGADPSGAFLEDRTATVHFHQQGESRSWMPVR